MSPSLKNYIALVYFIIGIACISQINITHNIHTIAPSTNKSQISRLLRREIVDKGTGHQSAPSDDEAGRADLRVHGGWDSRLGILSGKVLQHVPNPHVGYSWLDLNDAFFARFQDELQRS